MAGSQGEVSWISSEARKSATCSYIQFSKMALDIAHDVQQPVSRPSPTRSCRAVCISGVLALMFDALNLLPGCLLFHACLSQQAARLAR